MSEEIELHHQTVSVKKQAPRAETYCMARDKNGVRCNARIPLDQKFCTTHGGCDERDAG